MPNFSCADLVAVQVMASQMWADNREAAVDNDADVVAAQAVLAEQTADLTLMEDHNKDYDVRVTWVTSCDETVVDCTGDECSITGTNDTAANCQDYVISQCKETSFSFLDKRFRTSKLDFQTLVAKELMKRKIILDEQIAKYAVAQIDSYAGVNAFLQGYGVSGNVTQIPASQFNASTYAYFAQAMILNKMKNSWMLDGGILFQDTYNSQFAELNANGKAEAAKFRTKKTYFDLFNIAEVIGGQRLYMLDKGSVAIANKHHYEETPVSYNNGANVTKSSVASDNLVRPDGTPFMYDLVYQTECVGEDILHKWKLIARFDVFLNPLGCNADNTGVLAFECV